jgi:hypothetical protein
MNKWAYSVLLALIGLVSPSFVEAVPTIVQHPAKCESSASASIVCAFGSPVVDGHTVIVAGIANLTTVGTFSVTDTLGNLYSVSGQKAIGGHSGAFQLRADNVLGGFTTLTITNSMTDASSQWIIELLEVSGLDSVNSIDQVATNGDTTGQSSFSTGTTPTTTSANELLVGILAIDAGSATTAFTAPGGAWTEQIREIDGVTFGVAGSVVTQIVSSTGAYQATWTALTTAGPPLTNGLLVTYREPATVPQFTGSCTAIEWTANPIDQAISQYVLYDRPSTHVPPVVLLPVPAPTISISCASITDTTAPSQVTGVSVQGTTNTTAVVTSAGATDAGSTGLSSGLHIISLTAVNAGGESPHSLEVPISITGGTVNGIGVYRYELCPGIGCTNFALWSTTGTQLTTNLIGLTPNMAYRGRINAQDIAGNQGPYSSIFTFTTGSVGAITRITDATDSFARADENPLGNGNWSSGYTTFSNCKIVSQLVVSTTPGSTDCLAAYTNFAWANDQWSQLTIGGFTTPMNEEVIVRAAAAPTGSYYACNLRMGSSFTSAIRIYVNGSVVGGNLAVSTNETWNNGDVALCQVQNDPNGHPVVSFFQNGNLVTSYTDTANTYASGSPGFVIQSATQNVSTWSGGHFGVVVPPVIASAICDTTGCTVTSGATTPSFFRVQTDTTNLVYPWNDGVVMTAGRYTQPGGGWANGLTFVCFFAQDANHTETGVSADYRCGSLVGLTLSADVTPPVLSGAAPSGTLAQGTTSTTISLISNEPSDLRYGTTDVPYASLPTAMTTVDGLHHSATVTGLTNGGAFTYYVRGQDRAPALNVDLTSTIIAFQVGAASDTTPPVLSGGSPSGALAHGTTSVSMTVQTNENATCKYGTTAGVAYASQPNTFSTGNGTQAHSTTISGLSDGQTITEYVRCLDTAANADLADYVITWSISSVVAGDTTPPVRSAGLPSGVKTSGTTSVSMTLTTDENATCKYGIAPGVAYAAIANTFSTGNGSTSHSQTISGLVDGQVSTFYIRCLDGSSNANLDDFVITWSVAVAANDSTAPTAPALVSSSVISSSQATITIGTASTDAVGVIGYQATIGVSSGGACTPTLIVNPTWSTALTQPLLNLVGNTTYCLFVKGFDQAQNVSAASNTTTFTTPALVDPIPPSQVTGCVVGILLFNSVSLSCAPATDNVGVKNYTWYRCELGVECPNYIVKYSTTPSALQDTQSLKPLTTYQYVVYANDFGNPANVSLQPSQTIVVTTPAVPASLTQGLCKCPRKGR